MCQIYKPRFKIYGVSTYILNRNIIMVSDIVATEHIIYSPIAVIICVYLLAIQCLGTHNAMAKSITLDCVMI